MPEKRAISFRTLQECCGSRSIQGTVGWLCSRLYRRMMRTDRIRADSGATACNPGNCPIWNRALKIAESDEVKGLKRRVRELEEDVQCYVERDAGASL